MPGCLLACLSLPVLLRACENSAEVRDCVGERYELAVAVSFFWRLLWVASLAFQRRQTQGPSAPGGPPHV